MSGLPPDAPGDDDDDLGPPAIELQGLEAEPSAGFFDRIRSGIDRRVLTGQLFEQAWTTPLRVFLEYVGAVVGLLTDDGRDSRSGGEEPER